MNVIITGAVVVGRVVPDTPLPEGARVEVRLANVPEVPADLQAEFAAWCRASDRAPAQSRGWGLADAAG